MSKYAGKDFDAEKLPGLHRYEVAQGFEPQCVKVRALELGTLLRQASDVMGSHPGYVWQSQAAEGWQGPPAVWASCD